MRRAAQPLLMALAALFALFITALPGEAQARWLRAESPHFVVYSDGDEQVLRAYVQKLETFDQLLRGLHGLPVSEPSLRRFELYLVGSNDDMRLVRPDASSSLGGFYAARAEDIFGVGLRIRREDYVLFHEYVHHFMYQHFPHAYPGWLVEGYAEYFMGAQIESDGVTYGDPAQSRGFALFDADWLPLERLVTESVSSIAEDDRQAYYGQSWLMTHWFMSDPERRARLFRYMTRVGDGENSVEALEEAAGMPVRAFERTLQSYLRGGLPYARIPASAFSTVEVSVSRLPESADALLLLNQRQRLGVAENQIGRTLELIRTRAARFPDDAFALLVLGHAELHMGDADEGERLLNRVLELQPANAEALQLLASRRRRQAEDAADRSERVRLLNEGNAYLARALEIDPDDYRTYLSLALSREDEPSYPNDNDIALWAAALDLAPQLSDIRFGLGRALMRLERFDEAVIILGPVANGAHGGAARDYAARLVELARAQSPPITYLEFRPEHADVN